MLLLGVGLVLGQGCSCNGFPIPDLPEKVVGYCVYKNAFSGYEECKDYVGNWTVKEATDDCSNAGSTINLDKKCSIADDKRFGDCVFIVDKAKEKYAVVALPVNDKTKCESMERGCEFFGGGSFVPTDICGGKTNNGPTETLPVFQPGKYECQDPKDGDKAGQGPNGQICTMNAISGATEPGRSYFKYGNCELVRSQRPYYPAPPEKGWDKDDARMKDPAYVKENNWVKEQVLATACVCCHSTNAPKGTSNWYIEAGPNWINSMSDNALAMGAGWISSVGFGAYPKDQNNGFSRPTPADPNHTIFTTTDDARMRKFFEAELSHRGKKRSDFSGEIYAAGPLDTQRLYKPEECKGSQSIEADGTINWGTGEARYIYVMKADTNSPGVPPNLDIPEGTMWKVDVKYDGGTPIASGKIKYGEVPDGALQAFPKEGQPAAIEAGQKYYLYVLKDIANPLARCIVTAK